MMVVRRLKTYTSQTGYVYQYYFVGERPARGASGVGTAMEYVFDVTNNRSSYFAVSIFLPADVLQAWSSAHNRELATGEQYAVAKLRLLAGFDEFLAPENGSARLTIALSDVEDAAEMLGLD